MLAHLPSPAEYIAAIEASVPADPPPTFEQPLPRARAGTCPARWGIFSDGELHIQKGGQVIVLERFEFESLVAFLERMAVAE